MKILLLGKDGQVGWELQRSLSVLGEVQAFGRQQVDFANIESLRRCVQQARPDVIVNAAAYTAVDKAETDAELVHRINAVAVGVLAQEARQCNAWLVHYSTDYVFDGSKGAPYVEDDATAPLSVYGATKCAGEQLIRDAGVRHLILRTSWVFAARGGNFAKTMLRMARERGQLEVVADQQGAPTSAELIADATALALYRIGERADAGDDLVGTYHLTASGATTWHGYAQYVLELALEHGASLKASPRSVVPIAAEAYPLPAARPRNSRLDTSKFSAAFNLQLPDWRYHVQRLVAEMSTQGNL
jgi:dTDP-4-dehydrorhamnose reductase